MEVPRQVAAFVACAGALWLGACRDGQSAEIAATNAQPDAEQSGEVACRDPEVLLKEAGVCAKPDGDGCYSARLEEEPTATAAAAGAVTFAITNKSGAPLYFEAALGAPRIKFEVRPAASDRVLSIPEMLFCPNYCPEKGPVMEVDCRAPVPGMIALPSGASAEGLWSGNVAAKIARSCAGGPERHCLRPREAPAGRYVLKACAYAALGGETVATGQMGFVARAEPSGGAKCVEVGFDAPSNAPVAVDFN